jgi:hypothetical protein
VACIIVIVTAEWGIGTEKAQDVVSRLCQRRDQRRNCNVVVVVVVVPFQIVELQIDMWNITVSETAVAYHGECARLDHVP